MKNLILTSLLILSSVSAFAEVPRSRGNCVVSDGDTIIGSFRFDQYVSTDYAFPDEVFLYKNDFDGHDDHYEGTPQKLSLDAKHSQRKVILTEKGYVYRSLSPACRIYNTVEVYDFKVLNDSSLKKIHAVCYVNQ